ncbi:MAG: amidotransferase [gamma proteobacterium symbiont of Ctena orbiculata]|nr:MAG: amidotransferase [gamma proteobacterium symbiont of Ctena orbiculata]PVV24585.1 MAG: amidotransferase [gamma proteobacterium symbiont of Ctena orbiculata]PVV24696.1 MAG: amidotransferase [gamma proteobacterium symbiont of Ctena orbiculata]
MRAHYLQHVPFEGLGSIETWLQSAGCEITNTRLYESDELPEVDEVDLLVIMGGPMSVNDTPDYPWLVKEKAFIKSVIDSGKPVLGICLGAQLIASSLGADIYSNSVKEIGWFPIQAVRSDNKALFQFPEEAVVFHWHGETFDLPSGATQIAANKVCRNQAFQIGANVIGLQFHLETTPASAQAIVEHCAAELVDGETIQIETEILAASPALYHSINGLMERVLEYITRDNG